MDDHRPFRRRFAGAARGGQFDGLVAAIIARASGVIEYWRLIRPRIVGLVLAAMLVSAWTASETVPRCPPLLHALLGSAGVIVGAVAFNQRMECRSDSKMARTADRPLPSGRLTTGQVTRFGVLATLAGSMYLAVFGNFILLSLAILSWIFYVAAYTPMKKRSVWQTPVGAVAGAMPVLLGAAAVDAVESRLAWCLFGLVFLWQFPHSMAIAWLYRHEFAAAEVRVASVIDDSGRTAGRLAILGAALLLPESILPAFLSLTCWEYGVIAGILGIAYLWFSIRFYLAPTDQTARRLLRMSLVYLPLVFVMLLVLPRSTFSNQQSLGNDRQMQIELPHNE
jgi:protoheme IX farnesyltransferase